MKKFLYMILLFISGSIISMQEEMVNVITIDDTQDTIPKKHLNICNVLKNALEDIEETETPLLLPNIKGEMLPLTKDFLKNSYILQDEHASKVMKQVARNEFRTKLDTQSKLHTVLCAANFLDVPTLLKKCIKLWSQAKYAPTDIHPLPEYLDTEIARRMSRSQKLLDDTGHWLAKDLKKGAVSLLERTVTPAADTVWSNAFSHNGKLLAGGHFNGTISLYNLETDEYSFIHTEHTGVSMVQFNAHDSHIWSSGEDGTVKVWDIASSLPSATFQSPLCRAFVFRHIPQHNVLVADGIEHKLCFWNLANPDAAPYIADAHTEEIMAIEAAHNGSFFVSGSDDGRALVWNTGTRNIAATINHEDSVMSAGFSYDNRKLACGLHSGRLVVNDLETGQALCNQKKHYNLIWSVLFADKQDTLLCSGSMDDEIRLWDMRTQKCIKKLTGHMNGIQYMAMDSDRGILSSASMDHTLMLWDLRKLILPIVTLRREFSQRSTIRHMLMFEDADKSETPLDITQPLRKKLLEQFSPDAQQLLLNNLNITKNP